LHASSDPGLYRRFECMPIRPRAAVFLDRDGVLVEETGYLHKTGDIVLIPAASQAIVRLNTAGIPVIIVTNQAGIGHGYYTWHEFEQVQRAIEEQLRPAAIDGVWACAYHPDAAVNELRREHDFRKPNPGMILDAAACLNIDVQDSWLVGDKRLDIECAIRAGLAGAVLVRTGYGRRHESQLDALRSLACAIHAADDIGAAVDVIMNSFFKP
jgi:D-glycero-D-manno-heptose 1,7-bisphosphate phosphatase